MIGRATERDVASKATIKVMTDNDEKASLNRHPGLNFCGSGDFDEDLCDEPVLTGVSASTSFSMCASAGGLSVVMVNCKASTKC